jgi:hypothetical protein
MTKVQLFQLSKPFALSYLLAFFSFLSKRFSFMVFSGFFLSDFFESWPLDINISFRYRGETQLCEILNACSVEHILKNRGRAKLRRKKYTYKPKTLSFKVIWVN